MSMSKTNPVAIRSAVLSLLLMVSAILSFATTKGPDASGYTATDQTVFSFVDISGAGAGTSVLQGTDDGDVPLTMPFAFQFYGQPYTMVCVSANGALYFIASANGCGAINDFANTDLTVAPPPNDPPALLPFWTDLTFQVPGSGSVFYQTLGTTGKRRFVVQWNNAFPQRSQTPVTFEVVLFEATNRILFQYQNVDLGGGDPNSDAGRATIGIHNSGGLGSGQQLAWSYDAPVLSNNSALQFSPQVACEAVVASSVSFSGSGFAYNFGTQRFVQTVKLQNSGSAAITGPLTLVLDNLSGNATLYQPAGTTNCAPPLGSAYVTNAGPLAPGATLSLTLQFTNPTKAPITYKTRVLAGAGTP